MSKIKQAVVYIVGLKGQSKVCKIGVSSDMTKRLKQLSTGSPFEVFLHHKFVMQHETAAYKAESESHKTLARYRMNGEWFGISPQSAKNIVSDIVDKCNDNAKLWWDRVRARNIETQKHYTSRSVQDHQTKETKESPRVAIASRCGV